MVTKSYSLPLWRKASGGGGGDGGEEEHVVLKVALPRFVCSLFIFISLFISLSLSLFLFGFPFRYSFFIHFSYHHPFLPPSSLALADPITPPIHPIHPVHAHPHRSPIPLHDIPY
jgi:hypothetical protein